MKKSIVALACVGAFAFSGCAEAGGSVADEAPQGSNASNSEAETEDVDAGADEKEPQSDPTFGQSFTWDGGLSVKVSRPRPFQPSEYAAGTEGFSKFVRFEVTLVNNTGSKFDPTGFYTTVQSNDQEASEIFDGDKGMNGSPTTSLLDGRQAKFAIAYAVANPKDLVMDVTAGYDEEFTEYSTTYTTK